MNAKKAFLATALALLAAPVLAQTYQLPWHRIGPGGTHAGGAYSVNGSAGQLDAGNMAGGNLTLSGGFSVFPVVPGGMGPRYTVVDLGIIAGNAVSLNNSGQIVGYYAKFIGENGWHAGFWKNSESGPLELGVLGGDYGGATSINDSGQIVGQAYLGGNAVYHAAIWASSSASPLDLGNLGGSSIAACVNQSGQIVGSSGTPTNWGRALFWQTTNSSPVELGTLGGRYTDAYSINESNMIVGAASPAGSDLGHAVFWNNSASAPRDLGTAGLEASVARAINTAGQIVGSAAEYTLAFQIIPLYWPNGGSDSVRLATLGGNNSAAVGINASGAIVGYSGSRINGPAYAVLWNNSSSPATDLNRLIPANSGWVLQFANAINNSGEIVGSGTFGGQTRAFALIPVVASPRITAVARFGGFLQFGFTSEASHNYAVLSTSDLLSGTWGTVQSGIPGNGGTVQVTIPLPPSSDQPRQFFRIQREQ